MKITRKGYIRRFVRLFMKETNVDYEYAKVNAEYFAEDRKDFEDYEVKSDVKDCISDHIA